MDVKFRVRMRPKCTFYAAVDVSTRRAFSLALISPVFMFVTLILSSMFQFK